MLRLEKITEDNFEMAVKIKVTEEQDLVIAPTVYSLAQSSICPEMKPFLIRKENLAVGFILFIVDHEKFMEKSQ